MCAMLEDPGLASLRTDQDGADYQAIHPVCRAADWQEMLDLILGPRPSRSHGAAHNGE